MRYFVLTFIGDDRPGFVREIAHVIANGGGNWLESRMCRLDGKFAGLARISVGEADFESLKKTLLEFTGDRFALTIEDAEEGIRENLRRYELDILGNDRTGILHEVTSALATNAINLGEVTSNVFPATMTGTPMFSCRATIEVGEDTDLGAMDARLAEIADELGVDIRIEYDNGNGNEDE